MDRSGLPEDLEAIFKQGDVKDVSCAAFGDREGSHVLAYTRKIGKVEKAYCSYGFKLPQVLWDWLSDSDTRDYTNMTVTLGPNNSCFAWDTNSIRWHNLPVDLELAIQRWLSPMKGWKVGPPRIIALGRGGAYFGLTEEGEMVFDAPSTWAKLRKVMRELEEVKKVDWNNLQVRGSQSLEDLR